MRTDGEVSYYIIQHYGSIGNPDSARWIESSLSHFLFANMSHESKNGDLGDRYREMISKQSAGTKLWQKYGIHGFVHLPDADKVLAELRKLHPDTNFRIVLRRVSQATIEIEA